MSRLIRWEIIDAPTDKDPQRRRLLVKAALGDIHSLIRRFGAMCGRPRKERGGALFNFSLFLHQPTDENLDALKAELRSMIGAAAEAKRQDPTPSPPTAAMLDPEAAAPAPQASEESVPAPEPASVAEPPIPELAQAAKPPAPEPKAAAGAAEENVPAPVVELSAPEPAQVPEPAPSPEVQMPGPPKADPVPDPGPQEAAAAVSSGGLEIPSGEAPGAEPAPIDIASPVPAPEAVASAAAEPSLPPAEEKVSGISLTPPSGAAAAPAPQPEATFQPASSEQSPRTREPLCGAKLPVNSGKSLDNFKVGSYSRFAHAAGTSVLSNPGTMYNPLLIEGPAGSGKSHFLHGLARKFGEFSPDEPVLLSTGTRLAAAVSAAAASGRMEELEAFAGKSKALIIDDLHFLGISEENAAGLAKLVGIFLGANKQIVVSSLYPAKVLAAVDQALGLKLGGGHAVELKVPPESACKEIGIEALNAAGIPVDEASGGMFADRIGGNLAGLGTAIARLRKLSELRVKSGQQASLQELLAIVFGPDAEPSQPSEDELKAGVPEKPAQGSGTPAALLFPDGQEALGDWAWQQLHQVAQQNKWDFPFQQVLRKPYALDPIGGVPFAIAGDCMGAGAVSALVVGPAAGTELANHEETARHATIHLARDIPTAIGWVPQERIADPKVYALAYLDLSAQPAGGLS